MKCSLTASVILLSMGLSACSLSVDEPPVARQSQDLKDPDSDGVINARDNCVETPLGAVVDNDGCPNYLPMESRQQVHVLFANDSDEIPASFLPQIKSMAEFLKQYPDTRIELHGFASPVGGSQHNLALSQRRAQQVRQQLLQYGIQGDRVSILAYGDSNPVSADSADDSNTLSRRVTASVAGSDKQVVKGWSIFTTRAE